MRLYTVHLRRHGLDPDRDLVLVKEGFAWPAFLFSVVWALWRRLWLAAVAIVAVNGALALGFAAVGADPVSQAVASLAVSLCVGFLGNDWRRRRLARLGFAEAGVVVAENRDSALRRFLDSRPAVAAGLLT